MGQERAARSVCISFTDKSSIEAFDEEQFELYSIEQQQHLQEQLQQQHINQQQQLLQHHQQQQQQQHHHHQQLPQTRNKRLEKLKKLKLREIQSLALEGGDTGRGYCSCDEQWTGSTSSASSPTSVSPTLLLNQQHEQQQPTAQDEAQCQLKLQHPLEDAIISSTTSPTPLPSPRTMIITTAATTAATASTTAVAIATTTPNSNTEAHEKTSENGSGTNDATGGSGYNRTNKQCNGSTAMSLLKQQQQQQHHQHNEHDKINMMVVEKFNETNNFTDTISISPGSSSSNIKTITLRRNPIQHRLKQQHHVRFSDEKNFSD
ncbi:AT-rich binding protein-like [Calliphora vicina]|uniref:AT-rich binding protein-like n=1 Tax=Calliphora vicina TaxID=7373 RepID=UPI00325B5F9F